MFLSYIILINIVLLDENVWIVFLNVYIAYCLIKSGGSDRR